MWARSSWSLDPRRRPRARGSGPLRARKGEDGKPRCIAHQPLTFHLCHDALPSRPPSLQRSLLRTASLL